LDTLVGSATTDVRSEPEWKNGAHTRTPAQLAHLECGVKETERNYEFSDLSRDFVHVSMPLFSKAFAFFTSYSEPRKSLE
jgi:hypothetical protein